MGLLTTASPTLAPLPPLYSSLAAEPILCEMVELFVDEMPARMARMQAYFDRADWDGLRRSAHQIRSVSASYGFNELVPHAARLERTLTNRPSVDAIRASLATLTAQCSRVAVRAIAPAS